VDVKQLIKASISDNHCGNKKLTGHNLDLVEPPVCMKFSDDLSENRLNRTVRIDITTYKLTQATVQMPLPANKPYTSSQDSKLDATWIVHTASSQGGDLHRNSLEGNMLSPQCSILHLMVSTTAGFVRIDGVSSFAGHRL
jgi:hypothetical protein